MLEEARGLGFLGPGPVEAHLAHAAGFVEAIVAAGADDGWSPSRAVDLGTGGGVPGLPLTVRFADCTWMFVESGVRRAAFLGEAIRSLGIDDRVDVAEDRAEVVGRWPAARAGFDLVVARGFGPPAVVAECGAPFLRPGGRAVVSEPPGGIPERWPSDGLALVGMTPGPTVRAHGATYQVLVQRVPCPDRYPRRTGVPAKRPLF